MAKNEELTESINEIKQSLNLLKITLDNMNNTIRQLSTQKLTSSPDDSNIKSEIQSIKSLLLSRTQFPALPTVQPLIPSWQLESRSSIVF